MNTSNKNKFENFDLSEMIGGHSATDDKIKHGQQIEPTLPTKSNQPPEQPEPTNNTKRVSGKQRKASFEEYKADFLNPPKIADRKTVYVSRETRDRLDEIVRRLGERGASVSGFVENMARQHLDAYQDDIEQWKKL